MTRLTLLDTQNPVFQSVVMPFLITLLLVGAVVMISRQSRGIGFAVCGAAIAVLAAYWLVFSLPPFPPRSSTQKLGYLFAAAAALSLLCASRPDRIRTWRLAIFAVVIAGLAWIAEAKIKQGQYGPTLLAALVASVALIGLLAARAKPVDAGVCVLVAALGVACIAALAPSASITQMALAIAAATGGYLLWTWPKPRLEFAEAGTIALGAPLIWLGGQASLYSKANDAAFACVAVIAFGPFIRDLAFGQSRQPNDTIRPVITGLIAAALAAVAVLIAYTSQSAQSGYAG